MYDEKSLPTRRSALKVAVWGAPVIAVAATAPMAVASPGCPQHEVHRAAYVYWQFGGLTPDSRWQTGSQLAVNVTAGFAANNWGALSYSSEESGAVVSTVAHSTSLTFPIRVTWTSIPAGWSVSEFNLGSGSWKYTFSRTAAVPDKTALVPLGSRPAANSSANAIPVTPAFTGFASQVPWVNGQVVSNGPSYTFPWENNTTYIVRNARAACDLGQQVSTNNSSITVTPTAAFGARALSLESDSFVYEGGS